MRDKLYRSGALLVVFALILTGCGPFTAGQAVEVPDRVVAARDGAIAFIGERHSAEAPAGDLTWKAENITPGWPDEPVPGWEEYRFTAGDWVATVGSAVLPLEQTIYQVGISNRTSGFEWSGEVDAAGQVAERIAPDDARAARDAALAYIWQRYSDQPSLEPGKVWIEELTTPEGLLGRTDFQFSAGGWVVTTSCPVVAPDAVVCEVTTTNEATGFHWEGEVDAKGQVKEIAGPGREPATPVEVGDADLVELVNGNSAFAFDLYRVLREEGGNLFYSPHSISLALAMTYAGARGETEAQMAEALHFLLSQERLHPTFSALDLELASRSEGPGGQEGEGFQLNIVNALWGQEDFEFLSQFLDLLADSYGAGLERVDFVSDPEGARLTINDWVSDQTEGRIEDLIAPGVIDALTRLVLTNAIYFNAAWANPFSAKATEDGPFYLLDGSEVTVPMMRQAASFGHTQGEGYQAVELPYFGGELSMVILLPEAGEFEAFEGTLDAEGVDAILSDLSYNQVALTMPKFEFELGFSLKQMLSTLGMPQAFTTAADFSGMTGDRDLFISEVVHKAFVSVDEKGTEAAAATAVMMSLTAVQTEPVEVTVDQPFIFFIRDIETGAILFIGRVIDPSA